MNKNISKHINNIKDISLISQLLYINDIKNNDKKDILILYLYQEYKSFNIKLDLITKINNKDLKSYLMQEIIKHL